MASIPSQRPASSGSNSDGDQRYAQYDERKRKRMMSNRESARRSRMRKQKQLENLVKEVGSLQSENALLTQRIDQFMQMYVTEMSQKNVLSAQVAELTDRLRSMNMVLEIVSEANGIKLDIPEVPLTLTAPEPWQLPCPTVPITASADSFNF